MNQPVRIGIVVSHPIQHFCPQYVSFARREDCVIKVFFGSAIGYKKYIDKSFGKEISWGNLGLDKFDHVFLNGDATLPADKNLDAASLLNELEAYQPDLLITYGYYQKMVQKAQAWARQKNIPVAFISDSERRRQRPAAIELAKRVLVTQKLKDISYFLAVGDANEMYYRYYGVPDHKLIRMPFPVDIEHYKNIYANKPAIADAVKNKYGIDRNSIVCGVVGKVEGFKRQKDIIEAFKLLESSTGALAPLTLLVIGAGPDEATLRAAAAGLKKNKVVFTGFVMPEDLAGLYTAIDIYIHPSEKDAHSLAISEAIYMGCPVLISDRCGSYGTADDVQQGKNGFIFKTGDIAELASLIHYLAHNETVRSTFGAYARAFAVEAQRQAHEGGLLALMQLVQVKKQTLA